MKKTIALFLAVSLLIGALSGITLTSVAAGEYLEPLANANEGSEWVLFENQRHTSPAGSTVVYGKEVDVQLPKGYERGSFRLHIVATLNEAAVKAMDYTTYLELNNTPACDTIEITFNQVRWQTGKNDFYLYFNTASDTTSSRYVGESFSTDDPIRYIRMFSQTLATATAVIDFEKIAIEMVDIDLGSDGSDTYMGLTNPLAEVPGTLEITMCHNTTVYANKANAVAEKAITSDVAITTSDKAVFTNYAGDGDWSNVYGLYLLSTGEIALVYANKQYTFTHCLRKGGYYRLAVVKEGDAFTLYVNGVKKQSTESVSGTVTIDKAHTLGANTDGSNAYKGIIRDIRVWEDARTAAEIVEKQAYMSITGKEEGLVAAWQLHGNITHILSTHADSVNTTDSKYGDNPVVYKGTRRDQWIDYEVPADEIGEDYYTMVVIPDTQNITIPKANKSWHDITDWIAANLEKENIFHVTCLGDNGWSNLASIWQLSQRGYSKFAYDVSWSNVAGNHDYVWSAPYRDTREYAVAFGFDYINQTAASSSFAGYMKDENVTANGYPEEATNTYHLLDVAGVKWMVLCLEMNPRLSTLDWAESIIAQYPEYNVIINTHSYLSGNGDYNSDSYAYFAEEKAAGDYMENKEIMFNQIVKPYSNVKFVLCGHEHNGQGKAAISTNNYKREDGSVVYQMMINAQYLDTDDKTNFTYYNDRAVGMISLFRFSADGSKVSVNWYCPTDDKSYEPLPNGNEPAETFGASWNNKSNFILPLDGSPIGEGELQVSDTVLEVGNTVSVTFDINDALDAVADKLGLAAKDLTLGAKVMFGNTTYLLTDGETVTKGGKSYYRFAMDGLAFRMVNRSAAILPVVLDGEDVVYSGMVGNISLIDNCYDLYENEETSSLATALLNYVTAVNAFTGNTGLSANRFMDEEDRKVVLSSSLQNTYRKSGEVDGDEVNFFSMALDIGDDMAFNIVLEFTYLDELELRVTDETGKLVDRSPLRKTETSMGLYTGKFSGIDISDVSKNYGFTVYRDGEPVSRTFHYSVEAYIAAALRNDRFTDSAKELLTALAVCADEVEKTGEKNAVTMRAGGAAVSLDNVFLSEMIMWGDVNGDYKVDSTDARMTLQYFVGSLKAEDLILDAADVSYDEAVDSTDARLILQYFVGSLDSFPVEDYIE